MFRVPAAGTWCPEPGTFTSHLARFVYNPPMRILGVDPGEKRLGIAVSDPTRTLATPRTVLEHVSKSKNAAAIIRLAEEYGCTLIIIGAALDEDGQDTESSRRARNLAKAIREQTDIPVAMWDESGSTQTARAVAIEMGVPRSKRQGHLDDIAAAVILQSYLDAHRNLGEAPGE